MSVSIQTVEFERREAHLSELEDGPPFTVHGVALGDDDVTVGQSGIKKLWPAEELEKAADSLEGKNLVVDHENNSSGVVGRVTKAGYKNGTGVIYEAELFDDELAQKINNDLLEVSIRGRHTDVEEMEENEDGAKVVEDITFANLSIVPTGAAPSNTIEMGETEELSMAELSAFTDQLADPEIEPGMWVRSDDTRGVTISAVQDGEIEVDIYEESGDKWRSIGETEMMSVDSLDEWDVDEEKDIGAMEDTEENALTSGDSVSISGVPDNMIFTSEEDAQEFASEHEGLTGAHQMKDSWVPGADHKEFVEWRRDQETEQMASLIEQGMTFFSTINDTEIVVRGVDGDEVTVGPVEGDDSWTETVEDIIDKLSDGDWEHSGHVEEMAAQGDKVQWDDGAAQGVIAERKTDGCFSDRIDGDHEICADDDDPVALIEIVKDGERTGTMVAHKESTLNSGDFEMSKHKMDPDVEDDKESEAVDPPEFEEGMMVQWAVNPDMFGEIVHNPDDADIIMVEVMEMMDGEMKPTGHTLTAAPPDLEPMDREEMSDPEELESFSDYPEAAKENAQMALDAREETDNPNDCGTDVGWKRANQLASGEAVSEDVVAKMSSFNRHRQNSEMDDDEGKADCGWMMWKAWGGDEGVDWAMNKMDSMEEASYRIEGEENIDPDKEKQPSRYPDHEELQDWKSHSVDFSGTTTESWSRPDMEDFDTDDLSEIDDHFLISATGFPPENFTDLALPVVEPNGDLNLNALQAAKGGRGVSAVDGLNSEMEDEISEMINSLANDNFEDAEFGDEEEAAYGERPRTVDDTGDEPGVHDSGPVDIALDMINKYLTIEGTHERDSVDKMLSWLMGSVDLPVETLGDFRMAARRFLDETPGTDSFDGMTIEQFRDWLLMHGKESQGRREQDERDRMPRGEPSSVNVLTGDDLWQSADKSGESELDDITTKVTNMTDDIEQKLAELSEPVAVEQDDLEQLQDKADRFEEMSDTLSSLKERTDVLDDVDRDQVEELAEADEPVVVESARMESLEAEAEQVAATYASELAAESFLSADELTDKFSIEELREKYEEQIGDPAEELAGSESAEPKSGDVDEEELEERADEGSEEELEPSETDEAEEMRDELRNKILG